MPRTNLPSHLVLASAIALVPALSACTVMHHAMTCAETPGCEPRDAGSDAVADSPREPSDAYVMPPSVFVSARIEPADAVIRCDATQAFRYFAMRADGTEVEELPTWSSETPALGTVTIDGIFSARAGCIASGTTHVAATAPDGHGAMLTARAAVTVRLELDVSLAGVATVTDGDAAFAHPTGTGTASPVLYPLDQAVMPNNVLPPDIQWSGGAAGDLYRVTISNASVWTEAYVAHTGVAFHYDWTPPSDVWSFIAENYDSGVDIRVDRFDHGTSTVITGAPIHIRLTRSSISGAVYYWGLQFPNGPGEFDRIHAGTGMRDRILQGSGCVGCHSVSRDGRYLSGIVGGGSGSEPGEVFDLTGDVTATPPPTLFPPTSGGSTFFFSSTFSPDSTRLFVTSNYARLFDPLTGLRVAAPTLPPADSDHAYFGADWSPDGASIAMTLIDVATASWGHKFSHGDLVTLPVTGPDTFGPTAPLHDASTLLSSPEGGRVDNYASWSPDSNYVAFQHGNWSRSTQGTGDTFSDGWSSAAIYLVSRDGGMVQRLDTALAGAHGSRDYFPTFSPFVSLEPDGTRYVWLAFTSGRRYGNAQVGTAGVDPLAGRQIWVTALQVGSREFPDHLTGDPSNVPYWLPGQDTHVENLGAHWAPLACRVADASCGISSECCSGYCAPASDGRLTCMTPPLDMCRASGDSCGTTGDCCRGLACQGNACLPTLI